MTCPLACSTIVACLASPAWLSFTVKFTSDLSPRNIRCTRGSDSERLGNIGIAAFGKSTCTPLKNGGVLAFSLHWFSWLSPRKTIRFCSPNELRNKAPACRNAA
jgi:hypothetical protein